MASNLLAAGHDVIVWNRTAARASSLVSAGARVAESPADAVRGADVVIVMLSTGAACDEVLFEGESAAVHGFAAGSIVVVMSSIPVATARAQSERLTRIGVRYVDAPVSGGERGAIERALAIMAGGHAEDIAAIRPVMNALGRLTHVGPVGCGQLTKLGNQLIVGVTIGAVAEALLLVQAGGGDLRSAWSALQGGFADSPILRQHGLRMIERMFTPGARAALQLKDLLTLEAQAQASDVRLPFAALASELYSRMCADGHGHLDHSALILTLHPDRDT